MSILTPFHGDDVTPSAPDQALFHVLPVPYERTTSYGGGTALGPQAILDASCQLELFDGKGLPSRHGIYTSPLIECSGPAETVLQHVAAKVGESLDVGAIPFVIGGEHTVTLGCIDAIEQTHADFGVVQFDAHADLRESYQDTPLSHACVMRRVHEKNIPFFQIGTRSYSYDEHQFRQDFTIPHINAEELCRANQIRFSLPDNFPDKIYITFDVDVFDPSIMPATGTPVPGGLSWYRVAGILKQLLDSRICVGFDFVEFAPIPQLHHATYTVAQLIYNCMGYLARSETNMNHYQLDDSCV